jgi:hypothetical protein
MIAQFSADYLPNFIDNIVDDPAPRRAQIWVEHCLLAQAFQMFNSLGWIASAPARYFVSILSASFIATFGAPFPATAASRFHRHHAPHFPCSLVEYFCSLLAAPKWPGVRAPSYKGYAGCAGRRIDPPAAQIPHQLYNAKIRHNLTAESARQHH